LPSGVQTGRSISVPGTDLYLLDLGDGGSRRLFTHDRPGTLIERPVWTPDGKALVFSYSAPIQGPDGRYTGSIRELQRLDVASGERVSLVKDGMYPAFGPAGAGAPAPLAYVLSEPRSFKQAIWLADANGQGGRKLLETTPDTPDGFIAFSAPRFSPDGRRLVFTAVGGPGVEPAPPAPPGGSLPGRLVRWFLEPFNPPPAAAHGPPADLWTLALDGGEPRRLTELYEDDPTPVWSPDGGRVAFLSGGGLYVIGADGRGLAKLSDKGSYGGLVWAPR
jgi:Tol biopolymer transport system component